LLGSQVSLWSGRTHVSSRAKEGGTVVGRPAARDWQVSRPRGRRGAVGGVPSAATREPPPDGRLRARPGVARRMSWRTGSGSGGGRQSQQSSLRIDPPRTARTHLHSHATLSHKSVSVGPRGLRDTRPSSAERAAAKLFSLHLSAECEQRGCADRQHGHDLVGRLCARVRALLQHPRRGLRLR
jgi:hypothetical protein